MLTYICFLLDSITMSKSAIFFTLLILTFLTSCISSKRLTYLQQESKQSETDFTITKKPDPYRIQVNDLLSIRIKSLDQSEVGMFNPVGDQNPNATGEERLYYDGFLVNDHGNIRMPTLGEVNVLGYTVDEVPSTFSVVLNKLFLEVSLLLTESKLSALVK